MNRNDQASLRLPQELKREIREIAAREKRTLSNTMEILLRFAVDHYAEFGKLPPTAKMSPAAEELWRTIKGDEAFTQRLVDLLAERLLAQAAAKRAAGFVAPTPREGDNVLLFRPSARASAA